MKQFTMPHWDEFTKQPNIKVCETRPGDEVPWMVNVEGKVFVTRAVYMALRDAIATKEATT
jgi:hypothetical protein